MSHGEPTCSNTPAVASRVTMAFGNDGARRFALNRVRWRSADTLGYRDRHPDAISHSRW
jgi:hypothetical protein